MTTPVRLQLSRRKGFDLQALSQATNGLPAVNVARPSIWGNMFRIGDDHSYYGGPDYAVATADQCAELYRRLMDATPVVPRDRLRGRNLACWCKPGAPCHADVLLELASRPVCEAVD